MEQRKAEMWMSQVGDEWFWRQKSISWGREQRETWMGQSKRCCLNGGWRRGKKWGRQKAEWYKVNLQRQSSLPHHLTRLYRVASDTAWTLIQEQEKLLRADSVTILHPLLIPPPQATPLLPVTEFSWTLRNSISNSRSQTRESIPHSTKWHGGKENARAKVIKSRSTRDTAGGSPGLEGEIVLKVGCSLLCPHHLTSSSSPHLKQLNYLTTCRARQNLYIKTIAFSKNCSCTKGKTTCCCSVSMLLFLDFGVPPPKTNNMEKSKALRFSVFCISASPVQNFPFWNVL